MRDQKEREMLGSTVTPQIPLPSRVVSREVSSESNSESNDKGLEAMVGKKVNVLP